LELGKLRYPNDVAEQKFERYREKLEAAVEFDPRPLECLKPSRYRHKIAVPVAQLSQNHNRPVRVEKQQQVDE
jgi:hypothetical protein